MKEEGNLFVGVFWGMLFSIPLWISLFGWVKHVKGGVGCLYVLLVVR
ncbi:MAG: hypothetical protein ACQEWE_13700 [Bacillota bacterium]